MGRDAEDRAIFSSIVVPYLADAFALARWLSGNRADAEDILQDASLRAYRAINAYSGGSARAWLLTIVRNTAYTWLAKNRSAAFVSLDGASSTERERIEQAQGLHSVNAVTPETELISKVDAIRLESAITALPIEFRETFVLREVHGFDYRQIAEITATPLGTVMSRLARARRQLTKAVGDEQP
jgi:RNA polymerase sigma-70 factor (ECF subfamily)